jgi:nicotinamide riboside kinase
MATHDDVDRTICLTGPESSGKTTLALALGARLGAPVVPEIAREYLANRSVYAPEDVLEIARRQLAAERQARSAHRGLLICDTDLLVLRIWWREKYGALPALLNDMPQEYGDRAYLLLAPDLPWTPDPLRENPTDRERLFALHRAELRAAGRSHGIVRGEGAARIVCAVTQIESLSRAARTGAQDPDQASTA